MKAFLQWSLDRLKEKTTWIGIVGLASSIGWYIDPAMVAQIAQVGAALASLILMLTGEKK